MDVVVVKEGLAANVVVEIPVAALLVDQVVAKVVVEERVQGEKVKKQLGLS